MDRDIMIDAKLAALRFLVGQLYANAFLTDSRARTEMPDALIDLARYRSTVAPGVEPSHADELKAQTVRELERFFVDVESRIRQSEGR